MIVTLHCPACGRALAVPAEVAARPLLCNGCGARFFAPPGFAPYLLPPPAKEVSNRVVADAPLSSPDIDPTVGSPAAPSAEMPYWPKSPPPPPVPFFRRLKEAMDPATWAAVAAGVLGVAVVILIICLVSSGGPERAQASAGSSSEPKIILVAPPATAPATEPAAAATAPAAAAAPDPATQAVVTQATRPSHEPPAPPTPETLTDEQIANAIRGGAHWLLGRFDLQSHQLRLDIDPDRHNALDALCVYALAQAGQTLNDQDRLSIRKPILRGLLTKLGRLKIERQYETYGRGLRVTALAVYNRHEDQDALRDDVNWLLATNKDGKFGYGVGPGLSGSAWDNSNTQYGQLGVWAGEEAGVPVPSDFWRTARDHWEQTQGRDGSWAYRDASIDPGTLSMTAAGMASLFVAHDRLDAPDLPENIGTEQASCPPALQNALDWCQQGGHVLRLDGQSRGYTLYGLERIGLASGFKYLGDLDWYRYHASQLVNHQSDNGSWGDEIETAYALLFLARGRQPIMMNKLSFAGHWANHWRDAANLAHFAGKELERPIGWQVVPSDRDWSDWSDAPILYIASHIAPKLEAEEVDNIRRFALAGGVIFTHADDGQPGFNQWARDLAKRLFPDHPLAPLPPNHDLFSILYKLNPRPPLEGVSNGVRLLMVHCPTDIAINWHPQLATQHPLELQTGVNLFLYASGREELQHRLVDVNLPEPADAKVHPIRVARLQYGDDDDARWDPEPMAWSLFGRWFARQTGHHLDVAVGRATMLNGSHPPPLATLTGTEAFDLPEPEIAALRNYVNNGGTLLVDAAGGRKAFAQSARQLLDRAFPEAKWSTPDSSHPLLHATLHGMSDVAEPVLRPYARQGGRASSESLEWFTSGKGRVIFSPLDLTAGILATPTWGIRGYEPADARALVKNLTLWAAAGAPYRPVATMPTATAPVNPE